MPGLREHSYSWGHRLDRACFWRVLGERTAHDVTKQEWQGQERRGQAAPPSCRVIVLGGGYPAVDAAEQVARLLQGVRQAEVQLWVRWDTVLGLPRPAFVQLSAHAAGELERLGVRVRCATWPTRVTARSVTDQHGHVMPADLVLDAGSGR